MNLSVTEGVKNMKEIKAYVRTKFADQVIRALEEVKAPFVSALDVKIVGEEIEENVEEKEVSVEYGVAYRSKTKIEVFCEEKEVDKIVGIILQEAHTGQRGDGVIAVTSTDRYANIHNGKPL
jgi:nitrogen regulatory protein P-II 1